MALIAQSDVFAPAIPAVNVYDLISMQAVFGAAVFHAHPVIIAVGEKVLKHTPLRVLATMAKSLGQDYDVPWALHLDHALKMETLRDALELGFTSVMIDASSLPLDENIRICTQAAHISKTFGASLEVELGGLNDETGGGETGAWTDAKFARRLIEESGADMLAVSVGNRHGFYQGEPVLSLPLIEQIGVETGVPLVLHGCSGIPREILCAAATRGVRKINVNTEMAVAGAAAAKKCDNLRFDEVLYNARAAMQQSLTAYFGIRGEDK